MKLVMLIAALLLILAGCGPRGEGPHVFSPARADPPGSFIEPPPGVRPGPAPGRMQRPPPPKHCQIKTRNVVQHGVKRVTRYQVCR